MSRRPHPYRPGDTRRARHRKERVLHTRVSERLEEALRGAADDLRVPVSNLVRNVLEDVFVVVETVSENVGGLIDDVIEEADRVRDQWQRAERRRWERRRDEARQRYGHGPEQEQDEGRRQAPASEPRPFPDVVGWQPVVLNAGQLCASCGTELRRGESSYVALGPSGVQPRYLCESCLGALR